MQKLKVDMKIGNNLRSLRKEHGYTQDQLIAQMARYGVDVTRSYYSRFETGELNIPIQVLVALIIHGPGFSVFLWADWCDMPVQPQIPLDFHMVRKVKGQHPFGCPAVQQTSICCVGPIRHPNRSEMGPSVKG